MTITFKYDEFEDLNTYGQLKSALEDLEKDLNSNEANKKLKNWTKKQ